MEKNQPIGENQVKSENRKLFAILFVVLLEIVYIVANGKDIFTMFRRLFDAIILLSFGVAVYQIYRHIQMRK
jgi:hypothetical protein